MLHRTQGGESETMLAFDACSNRYCDLAHMIRNKEEKLLSNLEVVANIVLQICASC
jgi:hypothetical protein